MTREALKPCVRAHSSPHLAFTALASPAPGTRSFRDRPAIAPPARMLCRAHLVVRTRRHQAGDAAVDLDAQLGERVDLARVVGLRGAAWRGVSGAECQDWGPGWVVTRTGFNMGPNWRTHAGCGSRESGRIFRV